MAGREDAVDPKGARIQGKTCKGEADESRRETLKKLGRFAVYTAPAAMVLLTPGDALPCS
jgi:hypothetical protein